MKKQRPIIFALLFGLLTDRLLVLLFLSTVLLEDLFLHGTIKFFPIYVELFLKPNLTGITILSVYWYLALKLLKQAQNKAQQIVFLLALISSLPFLIFWSFPWFGYLEESLFFAILVLSALFVLLPGVYIGTLLTSLAASALTIYYLLKRKLPAQSLLPLILLGTSLISLLFLQDNSPSLTNNNFEYQWVTKPSNIFERNIRAFVKMGEIGGFTTYEPLGWADENNVVYKKHFALREPEVFVYNIQTQEEESFSLNLNLYVNDCNPESTYMGLIAEHCLPDRNASSFGKYPKVLISPNGKWALFSVAYSDSPEDLILARRAN